MKFCEVCGTEIATKDGENRCRNCEDTTRVSRKKKNNRKMQESILSELGLTKVRGAMGGVYWE